MKIQRLFCAHDLFILTCFFSAQSEMTIKNEKMVYAVPGNDVTLKCSILKGNGIHVTQTQWSKMAEGPPERIAVYNPHYGIKYLASSKIASSYSVNFSEIINYYQLDFNNSCGHRDSTVNYTGCNQWLLQLRNVSLEQTGVYVCSFATFPLGIRSSEIHLVIQKDDEKTSVAEILLNQTLEIPCFEDMPSVNLTDATLTWLMKENGSDEILISKQSYYQPAYIINPTIHKERIQMDPKNTLKISPVSVLDDGKKFVCSVVCHYGRIMKSTTEVKVFVKPEISMTLQPSFTGKGNLTCMIRKAFPKPNLLWYVDGMILKDKYEGILIENEEKKDVDGFYEMKSLLTIRSTSQLSLYQTFTCMCLYPWLGNETRNISSEEVVLPVGVHTTSSTSLEFISQPNPVSNSSTERFLPTTSSTSVDSVNQITPVSDFSTESIQTTSPAEFLSQTIHISHSPTRRMQDFTTTAQKPSVTHLDQTLTLPQSTPTSPEHMKFSWPAVVASLLFFCSFLIILSIRKWCQYQKEIMNRPPSFKPPPPPVKYTCMREFDGTNSFRHELENL